LRRTLIALTIILLIINVLIINNFATYERRIARLVSILIFFAFFLFYKGYSDRTILYVFILLILTDVFGTNYENTITAKLVPLIKICAYFLLIKRIFSRIKIKKVRKPVMLAFGLILILNFALVYEIVINNNINTNDNFELVLLFLYGVIIVGMCTAALNYNFSNNTNRSLYFLYFIFALVLSDTTWYIAYYMSFKIAFQIDILFYLIAMLFMVRYALVQDQEKTQLL